MKGPAGIYVKGFFSRALLPHLLSRALHSTFAVKKYLIPSAKPCAADLAHCPTLGVDSQRTLFLGACAQTNCSLENTFTKRS